MANRKGLIDAFLSGGNKGKASSLSIRGNELVSYATPIGIRTGNVIRINVRKYSHSTTVQQNILRRRAKERGYNVIDFEGLSR